MKDIGLLERTFKIRPICLRNMRISSTLLKESASAGLTLEEIGQILCRPDEDDSMPSLLERLIDKARLITDMMQKMQTQTKDGNLRSIEQKFASEDSKE
jgi:DNA-binding transcriptional MerR regulator